MRLIFVLPLLFLIACNDAETKKTPVAVANNGVRIAYTDTGRGETTLLFVHGWCINRTYWEPQVAHFAKSYRVVTVDLPGFGESGKNRNTWGAEIYAKDVDSVIRQLDLKNVILIGHSMSGNIVLQAALDNKDRVVGVVGVDNFKGVGIPWSDEGRAEYAQVIGMMRKDFRGTVLPFFEKELFSPTTPPSVKDRVIADIVSADTVIAVACMDETEINELEKLKQWGKPLHLINSDVTPTFLDSMKRNNVPFNIEYTRETGHYAMVENPEEFNRGLERIIRSVEE